MLKLAQTTNADSGTRVSPSMRMAHLVCIAGSIQQSMVCRNSEMMLLASYPGFDSSDSKGENAAGLRERAHEYSDGTVGVNFFEESA